MRKASSTNLILSFSREKFGTLGTNSITLPNINNDTTEEKGGSIHIHRGGNIINLIKGDTRQVCQSRGIQGVRDN